MALPPTIPTSFVPRQVVVTRKSTIGFNPFLLIAYVIFGIWVIVGLLVFSYQWYLTGVVKQKAQELTTAQNNIDQTSVNDFVKLRDRFTISKQTLDKHVMLSQFFDKIESITIQNGRFTNLRLTVLDNRTAKIQMGGAAKNFNALAAQSSSLTSDKEIKNAIFSGFVPDSKTGTVTFQLDADLEPSLITQTLASAQIEASPPAPAPSAPATAEPNTTKTTPTP